jgi:cytochrome d ubiquinol oxidase subunit I
MWMAALVAPLQIFVGDLHGLNTLEHQPAKVMAMEGHYQSHPEGAPLILFGIPNDDEQRMEHAIEVPKLSSLILKHDADAPLAGLDTIKPENRPPVKVVFWSFRVMVGLGMLMLLLGVCSLVARAAKKLYDWRWLHRFALVMGPSGFIAVIAGWVTTEVGRQPFTVYGLMRTAESASPLAAPAVATSLIVFVVVYFAVFGMGTWYLFKLMHKAPQPHEPDPPNAPAHAAGITPAPAIRGGSKDTGKFPETTHD